MNDPTLRPLIFIAAYLLVIAWSLFIFETIIEPWTLIILPVLVVVTYVAANQAKEDWTV